MKSDIDKILEEVVGKNDAQQEVSVWLDTGYPPLNRAISGESDKGLPCGRIVEIFGPSACGKTAISTRAMISAQQAGGIAVWMDHEHAFDLNQAVSMGLNPDTRWVYKHPETFEDSIDMAVKIGQTVREKKMIPANAPIIVVFDSLASMVPKSKFYDSKGKKKDSADYSMHDNTALARATSASFPALAQMATKYNMCLLFINQTRTKPGVAYGDPNTTPGGNAPEYYASLRIGMSREMIKDKTTKELLGQTINAVVRKNRMYQPFKRASWNFMFRKNGTGYFDVVGSLVDLLKEQGVLKKNGHRLIWPSTGTSYFQKDLVEFIETNNLVDELTKLWSDANIAEVEGDVELIDNGEEDGAD